jgi:hypothetical protein
VECAKRLAVLNLANLSSANNLHSVPKARMFPEHTNGFRRLAFGDAWRVRVFGLELGHKVKSTLLSYGELQF